VSHDAVDTGCIFLCENGQRIQLAGLGERSRTSSPEGGHFDHQRSRAGGGARDEEGARGARGPGGQESLEEAPAGGVGHVFLADGQSDGQSDGQRDRRALALVVLEVAPHARVVEGANPFKTVFKHGIRF